LENVTQADEIELLERKLEYLRAKKELDLELEIVKAKLQKLNQDYSDVVDTKVAVSASSTSEVPETSEPTEPAKVEEAPAKVASSKDADREWVATDIKTRVCKGWTAYNIKIDEDGTFSFDAQNPNNGWRGHYKGNLRESSAKFKGKAGWLDGFEAEQANGAWKVKIKMAWGGGGCNIKVRFE
jgi:hypothetical protein